MSESIEMYLLRIALLQESEQPVPVPRLAQELAVSPVSANEMCRKLTERALITYEPYKGVLLTTEGETLARRVLRHRRLWEVFFVDKLGLPPLEAEEIACRFEHVTPPELASRLEVFLEYPTHSPQNEPIPGNAGSRTEPPPQPLSQLAAGAQARVVEVTTAPPLTEFLQQQQLYRGAPVRVLAAAEGDMLLDVAGRSLSLARTLTDCIAVTPLAADAAPEPDPQLTLETDHAPC